MNFFSYENFITQDNNFLSNPEMARLHIYSDIAIASVLIALSCGFIFWLKKRSNAELLKAHTSCLKTSRDLHNSEQRFKLLVSSVREYAIFMIDPEGIITTWNDGAERILGYMEKEVLGKSLGFLGNAADRAAGHCLESIEEAKKHQHFEFESQPVRDDGSTFYARVSLSAMMGPDQELLGFTVVVNDISDRIAAESALKAAKEEAEAASLAKSAFLANMSHEIRTPLGVILGLSDLISTSDVSGEEWEEYTVAIRRNGELLLKIINDILDISKVEAGRLELDSIETDIHEIVEDVHTLLQIKATEKTLQFTARCTGVVPRRVVVDSLRLKQILFNVVGNALKFTESGFVRLHAYCDPNGDSLIFEVHDSGPGLTTEQRQRLFTPFTQAEASTSRKFGGSGLGLALSRRLAHAMGGELWISDSTPGKGTTFSLSLPLIIGSGVDVANQNPWLPRESLVSLHGLKVLVVDDSADNLMVVGRILTKAGANVTTCEGGIKALSLTHDESFDVILMDLQMPDVDGYKVTETLRQRGFARPIFALTAHAFKEERARCLRSGFDGHLIKPVDKDQLVKVLTSMARRLPSHSRVNLKPQPEYRSSRNEYAGPLA